MRTATLAFVGIVLLVLLAPAKAADKPQDLIVGKWETQLDNKMASWEFKKDGTFKGTEGDDSVVGKYKFIDDKTLELSSGAKLKGGGEGPKAQFKITFVTKDELTATRSRDGKDEPSIRFKRFKE